MHTKQVKSWKYLLQTSKNCNKIQDPIDKQNCKIFRNTNCKTEYAIHLMECNLQNISKKKTPFNIKSNNYSKDVKEAKAILKKKTFKKMVKE